MDGFHAKRQSMALNFSRNASSARCKVQRYYLLVFIVVASAISSVLCTCCASAASDITGTSQAPHGLRGKRWGAVFGSRSLLTKSSLYGSGNQFQNGYDRMSCKGKHSFSSIPSYSTLGVTIGIRCGGSEDSIIDSNNDESGHLEKVENVETSSIGSESAGPSKQEGGLHVDTNVAVKEMADEVAEEVLKKVDEDFVNDGVDMMVIETNSLEDNNDTSENNSEQKAGSVDESSTDGVEENVDAGILMEDTQKDDEDESDTMSDKSSLSGYEIDEKEDMNASDKPILELSEDLSQSSEQSSDSPSDLDNDISQETLRSRASELRSEGKTLHDSGSLNDAALAFREAASLLDEVILKCVFSEENEEARIEDEAAVAVEWATCRLHEALCLLKDGRNAECVDVCSDVLQDGVAATSTNAQTSDEPKDTMDSGVEVEENDAKEKSLDGVGEEGEALPTSTSDATMSLHNPTTAKSSHERSSIPTIIRARAHHRRAKALLAIGDLNGALEDARAAAFMGDRNAVAFYGRLMREGSGAADSSASEAGSGTGLSAWGNNGGNSPFGAWGDGSSSSSNPFLEGLLAGNNNPFMPSGTGGSGSSDFSSSLLSSLLSSGTNGENSGSNPFGLLGDLLSPPSTESKTGTKGKVGRRRRRKKNGMDGLAKSVLSSLMKRIEDERTQEQICNYLHSTDARQIMQFSSMAGVPMTEENAKRLVGYASGITPKGISKNISRVKRGVSVVKTLRKILKVIDKYKSVIILVILCYWIKSAITEPYPVSKRSKKLAQKAAALIL